MKKTIAEKLDERKIKKPPKLLYLLLANVWKILYFKKLGVEIESRVDIKKIKSPFVLVSNHGSRLDYIFMALPFLPHRVNYVVGYNEFFRSHLHTVFGLMQVIPKRNFTSDVHAVRQMMSVIRQGGNLAIMPEGMSSISGANQPCAIGSGKLLKALGVTVYMTKLSGAYLTSTKYCLDERPGKVHVLIDVLFTPEELSEMSADDIQTKLDEKLYNDDYEYNKAVRAKYDGHGELCKNMHTLLYKCPRCGEEFKMADEGNRIFCRACGNTGHLNEYYDLMADEESVMPETPRAWFDMQREAAAGLVAKENFKLTEKVKLGTLPKYKYLKNLATSEITGEGEITLDKNGLTYTGTNNGEPFEFFIKIQNLPTYGMCTDVSRFYTFYKGEFFEFYPERETVEKWFLCTEELHRLMGGTWVVRRGIPCAQNQ